MRLDPRRQQAVDQAVVVIEPLLVGLAAPSGKMRDQAIEKR
jgi:hypothetical protein